MTLRAQHPRQRQPVHARQVEVYQRGIERTRRDLGQRRQAMPGVRHAVALGLQQAADRLGHDAVVLDQQQAQRRRIDARRIGRGRGGGDFGMHQRQVDNEAGAHTRFAFDTDPPTHRRRQFLRDRQTQPATAVA